MGSDSGDSGLVVARHRHRIDVEDGDGERVSCIAGRRLRVLCGDRVEWRREPDGTCVVTRALPRETLLTRIDGRGRPEPVAANLTQLVAVVAATPAPDWSLLDRYLVAAELMGVAAAIVYNKRDVAPPPEQLAEYARIGYAVAATSAADASGTEPLAPLLDGRRSALLGPSGVGKSSLLNALVGDAVQAVGTLGARSGQGRHTTTTAVLERLPGGGEILDTPGVRHYAPYIGAAADVARGFHELGPYRGSCRFGDCLHRAEPGCAVKAAVETGAISRARYGSYLGLLGLCERR